MVRKIVTMAGAVTAVCAAAQEVRVDMHSELQTNGKEAKWLGLFHAGVEVPIVKGLSFETRTISVASSTENRMMDDLQGFSNIESDPIPLTFALLNLRWETEKTSLAFGVRNVNESYFISDLTSLFTNSSCGIFPTISANYDIANYPVASVGVDFSLNLQPFTINASVYNGRGYSKIWGKGSVFSFNPKRDGVFGIASLGHEAEYGNSHLGVAMLGDEDGFRATIGAYSELNITEKTCLHLQYSYAFGEQECKHYAGAGFATMARAVRIGLLGNFARFADCDEWAMELTAAIPVTETVVLQPAMHAVITDGRAQFAGLLRLSFGFVKNEWRRGEKAGEEPQPCNNKK